MKYKKKSLLLVILSICLMLTVAMQVIFFLSKMARTKKIHIEPNKAFAESNKLKQTAQPQKQTQQSNLKGTASSVSNSKEYPDINSAEMSIADYRAYLEKKERELEIREKKLKEKEAILKALQKDIEEKLAKLEKIYQEIEKYKQEQEQLANQKINTLVKIYTTMKPKDAASLLEKLDQKLVVQIISRMNTDKAAKIIANMSIKKAAEITQKLSEARKLSVP